MKDPNAPRTGVLECEKGSASFYFDDFSFCIMNNIMKKVTNRFGETYNAADFLFTLKKQGNFLIGSTTDGKSIAIYAKNCLDNIPVSRCTFRTSTYIIQDAICNESFGYSFDAIQLEGGTLSSLFSNKFVHVNYSDNGYLVKDNEFELTGNLLWNNQNVTIRAGWFTSEQNQPRKLEISTNNPYFRFEFSTPVNLDDALLHVEKARELMSFLSYRDNVEFDRIIFQRKRHFNSNEIQERIYYSDDAHTFINYGFELTEKESYHCICFDEIGNATFKLLSMFYDISDYNPIRHLGFIPKSDKESHLMTPADIREIATFLECEEHCVCQHRDEKSKVLYDENKRLSNLLSKIKELIKSDEDENGILPDSIHDQLTKRFQNVTFPSKHNDVLLFESYRNIIKCITPHQTKIIGSEAVKEFRNYRNKETHGNYNLLDINIALTALHLVATVYCSILHRAGVDDQTLEKICDKGFIE